MPIFRKKPISVDLPSYRQGKVIPVLSAEQLLHSPGHQALMGEIRSLTELPHDQFELLYEGFVHRFAEFVQLIPTKPNSRLGTLLNRSLLLGVNTLHYLLENHRDADSLERYALFTAAVLYDVSNTLTHQRIFITEKAGSHIADWVFSQGSLREQRVQWYKIMPYKANFSRLRDPISVLLGQQILPKEGYEWITSHWSVFVDWLDALCQTGLEGKRFNLILDLIRHEHEELFLEHLPDIEVDVVEPEDTVVADEFLQWLGQEIEDEKLKVGGVDPEVYIVDGGIFLDSRVVDKYAVLFNSPGSVVWQQLENCLGLSKKGGSDFRFDQFFGNRGKGLLQSGQANSVKGLYLSNDFTHAKGAVSAHVNLREKTASRDFQVAVKNTIKPTANK